MLTAGALHSRSAAASGADIVLWCEIPNYGLGPLKKGLVSIDTNARHVKIEFQGMVAEWKDGASGNSVRGAAHSAEDQNMRQFVTIDGSIVRYGIKSSRGVLEDTIDLRTGTLRSSGQVTKCTDAKR